MALRLIYINQTEMGIHLIILNTQAYISCSTFPFINISITAVLKDMDYGIFSLPTFSLFWHRFRINLNLI